VSAGSDNNGVLDVSIETVPGIEHERTLTEKAINEPPTSIVKGIGGIFGTIAAVRGKPYWKLEKTECSILAANEKSVKGLIPASILAKFGIISFAVVLIAAIIKRTIKDLKEIRKDDDEYEDDEYEDDEYEDDEYEGDEAPQKVSAF